MRIAVQPHDFELGGSQLNAVELARAVRERDHEVFVVCWDGPIAEMADSFGLPLLRLPADLRRPSPAVVLRLAGWARTHRLDVHHGYEWPPVLEGWSAALGSRMASVGTVYSMEVAPFLPSGVDLVVGTHQIAARARDRRLGPLHVVEPPVDTAANRPGVGGAELRRSLGIGDDRVVVTVVGRLARALKLEGVLGAVEAVGELARAGEPTPVLLVVGDGAARGDVERAAAHANAGAVAPVVMLTGQMDDPRPAYDAADICLGMGGSALRALAFGKPLIVQGERGFWRTLTPESHRIFAWGGWYGVGDGGSSRDALLAELRPLVGDAGERDRLGRYGLELVRTRYGLDAAGGRMLGIYSAAQARRARPGQVPRVTWGVGAHKVRRRLSRRRGEHTAEDFNQVDLLGSAPPPAGWAPPRPGPVTT